ncbi:hypothetical protein ACFWV1_20225 [Streptomyces sp. NPDC058700]|uniref:hypothetical protein n=1 Tax=Streptomyces sp. NPDC058700 TaxID=3346607 RepID=UPI003668F9FF
MASKSRAYTRPGADPTGRFRPVATPEQVAKAEQLTRALAPARPSEMVRSEAWYARSRERERAPLAHVWAGLIVGFVAVISLLRFM